MDVSFILLTLSSLLCDISCWKLVESLISRCFCIHKEYYLRQRMSMPMNSRQATLNLSAHFIHHCLAVLCKFWVIFGHFWNEIFFLKG